MKGLFLESLGGRLEQYSQSLGKRDFFGGSEVSGLYRVLPRASVCWGNISKTSTPRFCNSIVKHSISSYTRFLVLIK